MEPIWLNAAYLPNAFQTHSHDERICVEAFEMVSMDEKQYHGVVYSYSSNN